MLNKHFFDDNSYTDTYIQVQVHLKSTVWFMNWRNRKQEIEKQQSYQVLSLKKIRGYALA